mmetsp:Transcript_36902/g.113964  ORF Transcript_36902/g.113964 Transcript_36902/m.113964 type:complete len:124 (-) Transcript_36902:1025-1396(-)
MCISEEIDCFAKDLCITEPREVRSSFRNTCFGEPASGISLNPTCCRMPTANGRFLCGQSLHVGFKCGNLMKLYGLPALKFLELEAIAIESHRYLVHNTASYRCCGFVSFCDALQLLRIAGPHF